MPVAGAPREDDFIRHLFRGGRLKILLAGQKSFGAAVFEMLLKTGTPAEWVTSPLGDDALTRSALRAGLDIIPPGGINDGGLPGGVDLIIAAHSHDFIGAAARRGARIGAIGYHPSLLPLHRGRDAVRWAIKMGDRVTGGSVYWLDDNVDGGPLAAQAWCFIRPGDTAGVLWRRDLFPMGLALFDKVLRDIEAGRLVMEPQDEALATWEPSWDRPPLYRPGLLRIGSVPGFEVISRKGAAK